MADNQTYETIDAYIALHPPEVQAKLKEMRAIIKNAAPTAGEKISWRMPTFTLNGNLVHFAAFKKHLGFYPGANGVSHFLEQLQGYKTSKGAIQFPYGQPLPHELIAEIVAFRIEENKQIAQNRMDKKGI